MAYVSFKSHSFWLLKHHLSGWKLDWKKEKKILRFYSIFHHHKLCLMLWFQCAFYSDTYFWWCCEEMWKFHLFISVCLLVLFAHPSCRTIFFYGKCGKHNRRTFLIYLIIFLFQLPIFPCLPIENSCILLLHLIWLNVKGNPKGIFTDMSPKWKKYFNVHFPKYTF